jgi:hypothetical protein
MMNNHRYRLLLCGGSNKRPSSGNHNAGVVPPQTKAEAGPRTAPTAPRQFGGKKEAADAKPIWQAAAKKQAAEEAAQAAAKAANAAKTTGWMAAADAKKQKAHPAVGKARPAHPAGWFDSLRQYISPDKGARGCFVISIVYEITKSCG